MVTLTASPRTHQAAFPAVIVRRAPAAAAPRPSFWKALLRALSAFAA